MQMTVAGKVRAAGRGGAQPEADMQVRQAMAADKLAAGDLMATSLLALPPVVPLEHLLCTLAACGHASFPVTMDPAAAAEPGQVDRIKNT